jgi:hypothetical protein
MPQGPTLNPLLACYERVTAACDALESIADSLPDRVAAGECEKAADETVAALVHMHDCETRLLLPLLRASQRPEFNRIAKDIDQTHKVDSEAAMEVEEVLKAFAHGRPILSTDATGYLLRAFFEGIRRHIGRQRDLLALVEDTKPAGRSLH